MFIKRAVNFMNWEGITKLLVSEIQLNFGLFLDVLLLGCLQIFQAEFQPLLVI